MIKILEDLFFCHAVFFLLLLFDVDLAVAFCFIGDLLLDFTLEKTGCGHFGFPSPL